MMMIPAFPIESRDQPTLNLPCGSMTARATFFSNLPGESLRRENFKEPKEPVASKRMSIIPLDAPNLIL